MGCVICEGPSGGRDICDACEMAWREWEEHMTSEGDEA